MSEKIEREEGDVILHEKQQQSWKWLENDVRCASVRMEMTFLRESFFLRLLFRPIGSLIIILVHMRQVYVLESLFQDPFAFFLL